MWQKTLYDIFSNKWFWIALGAVLLFFILRRNWYKFKTAFASRDIDYEKEVNPETGEESIKTLSEEREDELDKLANRLRNHIHGTQSMLDAWWSSMNFRTQTERILTEVKLLSDQELLYLSQQYKSNFQNTLYEDIDNEVLPNLSADDKILTRLNKIGEAPVK